MDDTGVQTPADPQRGLDPLLARLSSLIGALEVGGLRPLMVDAVAAGKLVGCSARTVRRLRSAGQFPEPCVLGTGDKTLWRVKDLEEFVRCGLDMNRYRAAVARRT